MVNQKALRTDQGVTGQRGGEKVAKWKTYCPECEHYFTTTIDVPKVKHFGVRSKRLTGNQFEYSVTAPEGMNESGFPPAVTDDLILTGALAVPVGAACGFVASLLQPDYAIQFIGLGASTATALAWGWLCAEHNQRLKRVLPWFMEQKEGWAAARDETITGNVELSVDHRYRDGNTEAGRTTQRFGLLPVDVDKFNEWAQGALVGKSLSVPNWTPKAKMFTRPEYDQLLEKMRAGGIIINLGSNKGNTLTGGGKRALRQHLAAHGIKAPSPADDGIFGQRLAEAAKANGGNTPLPCPENGMCNA